MAADILDITVIFLESAIVLIPLGMVMISPYFKALVLRMAGKKKAVLKLTGPHPDASFMVIDEVIGNEAIRFQYKKIGRLVHYNPKYVKKVMGVPEYAIDTRDWRMIPQESPFAAGSYVDDQGQPTMVVLKEWLNKLVPPEDADGTYTTYQATARSEIEEKAKASNMNTIFLIMLGIIIVLGILSVITGQSAATNITTLSEKLGAFHVNQTVTIAASG